MIQKEGGRCRRVSQKADKTEELLKTGPEDGQCSSEAKCEDRLLRGIQGLIGNGALEVAALCKGRV